MGLRPNKRVLKDIEAALKIFPEVIRQKKSAHRKREKILKDFAPLSRKLLKLTESAKNTKEKLHPWRACSAGQHWVSSHPMHVPISEKNPGGLTTRDGHCRTNTSRKDQLYQDEIFKMANDYFGVINELPTPISLGRKNGNDFDRLIGGWTKYWNEVFDPSTPLDPNLVKALISTESDFKIDAKVLASKGNWARGLMQVTDQTLEILKDEKGELKDFLINVNQGDAHDPNLNICAGIRWLFHKKSLLEKRKRKIVSWEDAAMEYKAYTRDLAKKDKSALREWNKFLARYGKLRDG